jgi:murein L,D-transpeptidase YcbB/YkuD
VREARSSAAGQVRLMARYIVKAGLADALRQRDWAAFARGYNGPGYRANRYDAKLVQAFARHSSATSADTGPRPATAGPAGTLLKHGDRGAAVADVQVALTSAGHPVRADGVFGPLTAEAVRCYQRDHGLAADGVAGASTLSSLKASLSLWNRIGKFCVRLAALFGRSRERAA